MDFCAKSGEGAVKDSFWLLMSGKNMLLLSEKPMSYSSSKLPTKPCELSWSIVELSLIKKTENSELARSNATN